MSDQIADVRRIYENIKALLATGRFEGTVAPALVEAQSFVARIIEELNGQGTSEAGSSIQPEADAGRVGGDADGDRRKQGRRKKAK